MGNPPLVLTFSLVHYQCSGLLNLGPHKEQIFLTLNPGPHKEQIVLTLNLGPHKGQIVLTLNPGPQKGPIKFDTATNSISDKCHNWRQMS